MKERRTQHRETKLFKEIGTKNTTVTGSVDCYDTHCKKEVTWILKQH